MNSRSLLATLLTVTTVATTITVNVSPSYGQIQNLPRLGGKILPLIKRIRAVVGIGVLTDQAANAANARLNKCPNSSRTFKLTPDKWVGARDGFNFIYTSSQFIAISSPSNPNNPIMTDNVFRYPKNKWLPVIGTPYAFCVNGKNNDVEARWQLGR